MRVGIFIKKPDNIFSNGCIQQTFFLKKLFTNIGYTVDFLAIEKEYTNFELTNEPIIFTDESYDFSSYDCVLLGSLILLPETNQNFITNLLSYNVTILNLICGNVFVLHQEEFVFQKHNILTHYRQNYFTENWVLEMYAYARDYIQMVSAKDTIITPYVWDTDIIKNYLQTNNILTTQTVDNNSKVNLLIFEPNMSIHKNSFVPLLICDEYYKTHKDNVNKVYVFCGDNVIENCAFVKQLKLYTDKKLETYGRIIMPYIVDVIKKNNNFRNIVVSYNLLNNLNFLHLEMFYLGIPIIHNCKPFEKNDMYFDDFDLFKAVNIIEHTRTNFNRSNYIDKCKQIIDAFSPTNPKRIETYKTLFARFEKQRAVAVSSEEPTISKKIFYQGNGFILFVESLSDTDAVSRILSVLSKKQRKNTYVEIFVQKDVSFELDESLFYELLQITVIKHNVKINLQYVIKNNSFKHASHIRLSDTLMEDIKVYTK